MIAHHSGHRFQALHRTTLLRYLAALLVALGGNWSVCSAQEIQSTQNVQNTQITTDTLPAADTVKQSNSQAIPNDTIPFELPLSPNAMDEILKYMLTAPTPLKFEDGVLRREDGTAFFESI